MSSERLPWISEDPASLRLFELAQKVASAPTTLLISGESGTGKDYLARLVHELGPRRDAPFLKIDCASLPPQLVESELFGHERGAFTGAAERKLGRFELGGVGTIVLDEVAALLPGAQGKLLRVVQERTFERLGGTESIHISARLIALTNVDLPAAVKSGNFREDLYFRLNVLSLAVPPLRERPADILPLAQHLLAKLNTIHARPNIQLSEAACRMLAAYSWPGNVRELRNVLERQIAIPRACRFSGESARARSNHCPPQFAGRNGTPTDLRHPRSHALQNRQIRRQPGHQPQDLARKTQKVWSQVNAFVPADAW